MKHVVITGCSSGIGRELVSALLARGYAVTATMRRIESQRPLFSDLHERFGERLRLAELDVTSARDRDALLERLRSDALPPWALVNNAGYGIAGAIEEVSEGQIRSLFEVNVFGLLETTRTLLPMLRSAHGRIINISSVLGYSTLPFYGTYCASKHAVEALSEALYYELEPFGVQVAVVEPGAHNTRFAENLVWGDATPGGSSSTGASPYGQRAKSFREAIHQRMKNRFNPSARVVLAICDLLARSKMPLRTRVGHDAQLAYFARKLLPGRILQPLMRSVFASLAKN